jgi:apolipoprotein N-acyltransferase
MSLISKQHNSFVLAIFSALLLSIAWPVNGFAPLLLVGLVPLLTLEKRFSNNAQSSLKLFGYVYLTFLLWNLATTYWVYNSSAGGGIAAFICNALLMTIVFMLFHFTKKKLGNNLGYLSLPAYWIAFEYLHLQWDVSWPWLTLGNGFSTYYKWVQWYEYTGVFGGTLWIIIVNILTLKLIEAINAGEDKKQIIKRIAIIDAIIILPVIISYSIYFSYTEKAKPVDVVVVQPNIDPYNEKFTTMPSAVQVAKLFQLASTVIDSTTDYIVAPETALTDDIWEDFIDDAPDVLTVKAFIKGYPNTSFVGGLSSQKAYKTGDIASTTARKFKNDNGYYDSYNTAMQVENGSKIQLYHKSKLVPGVEKMPFPMLMKPFEKFAIDLGGTTGSLGTQADRGVFTNKKGIKIAPVICYESIYGEFVGGYIKNGANLIFIITNDGWWGNTLGYRQHVSYASLRAIETRRSIARSANTGTSCFINQRGDIQQATAYWQAAVIRQKINANDTITFYTAHGDYIAWIMIGITAILVALSIIKRKKNQGYRIKNLAVYQDIRDSTLHLI